MTDREKLIELLITAKDLITLSRQADFLIANGVTFDKDTNVPSNGDRIRAMTDDELADWLARTQIANVAEALDIARIHWEQAPELKDEVKKECLEWLKQPAEKDHENNR